MNNQTKVVVIVDEDGNRTVETLPARPPYYTTPDSEG
jgi:hypothetical protein